MNTKILSLVVLTIFAVGASTAVPAASTASGNSSNTTLTWTETPAYYYTVGGGNITNPRIIVSAVSTTYTILNTNSVNLLSLSFTVQDNTNQSVIWCGNAYSDPTVGGIIDSCSSLAPGASEVILFPIISNETFYLGNALVTNTIHPWIIFEFSDCSTLGIGQNIITTGNISQPFMMGDSIFEEPLSPLQCQLIQPIKLVNQTQIVNHYINQTVYVPQYINKTVYVPQPYPVTTTLVPLHPFWVVLVILGLGAAADTSMMIAYREHHRSKRRERGDSI